jgi:type VI secretion system protein ImpJ
MTMTIHQLAPVQWQMGQTLLPEHLLAQENALTGDVYLRYQANGLPGYGVSKLQWDNFLLTSGNLKIESLRLFTRHKSFLVDHPGNADIVSIPLDFADSGRTEVFYFILQDDSDIDCNRSFDPNNKSLVHRVFKIVLSLLPNLPDEYQAISQSHTLIEQGKLAEFVQTPNGDWKLSERYIPPLVQIGVCEFLQGPLKQLNVLLSRYLIEIRNVYQQQQLPDIRRFEIKHCANTLNQSLQYLANHLGKSKSQGEIHLHPYFLYEQLQRLDRALRLLSGEWASAPIENYQHNDLHGTFKRIFRNIISNLKLHSRNSQSFELQLKDGSYQAVLPSTLQPNDTLHLIINCEQQPSLPDHQLPCISSHSRMPTLFHYSLSGVPFKAVKHSALTHYFGDNTQSFQLLPGEELGHIIKDRSVAFLAQPEFENYTFYIFYQPEIKLKAAETHATVK